MKGKPKIPANPTDLVPWQTPTGRTIYAPIHHDDGAPITAEELHSVEAVSAGELVGEAGLRENYDAMLQATNVRQVPKFTMFDNIRDEPIRWLWPGRLPLGMFSLLVGPQGVGKTIVVCDVTSRVTRGAPWPDGSGRAPKGAVIILSAEDLPSCTIGPRLTAADADRSRVAFYSGAKILSPGPPGQDSAASLIPLFDPKSCLLSLDMLIRSLTVQYGAVPLVVLDPITSFMGDADQNDNAEVRSSLNLLTMTAARHGTAILGVSHMNKNSLSTATSGVLGSTAFVALARTVILVGEEPNSDNLCFLTIKSNVGSLGRDAGLRFNIVPVTVHGCSTAKISWGDFTSVTPDAVRQARIQGRGRPPTRGNELRAFILAQKGCARSEIKARAVKAGFSNRSVYRALEGMTVDSD